MTSLERSLRRSMRWLAVPLLGATLVGCSDGDPTGSGGEGTVSFTTWGEEYIEDEIPPDPEGQRGFIDGWRVKYDFFLVNFANIIVADQKGVVAATMPGGKVFDNHVPGVKSILDFSDLPAKAYSQVSYEIVPPTEDGEVGPDVDAARRQEMVDNGYSVYVQATATRDEETRTFTWGFPISTRYTDCHSEQNGRDEMGVVVTNNATLEAQLTTHGDHLFYDRLQASPDPSIATSLRFDAIAAAAGDDHDVTLEELDGVSLATLVGTYDRSGFPARTLGEFVTSLARTVGHFRGEGECTTQDSF